MSVRHLAPEKRLIAVAGLVGAVLLSVSSLAWHLAGTPSAGISGWLIEVLLPRL